MQDIDYKWKYDVLRLTEINNEYRVESLSINTVNVSAVFEELSD